MLERQLQKLSAMANLRNQFSLEKQLFFVLGLVQQLCFICPSFVKYVPWNYRIKGFSSTEVLMFETSACFQTIELFMIQSGTTKFQLPSSMEQYSSSHFIFFFRLRGIEIFVWRHLPRQKTRRKSKNSAVRIVSFRDLATYCNELIITGPLVGSVFRKLSVTISDLVLFSFDRSFSSHYSATFLHLIRF